MRTRFEERAMYRIEVEVSQTTRKRRYQVINDSTPFETEPWASPFRFRWSAERYLRKANERMDRKIR